MAGIVKVKLSGYNTWVRVVKKKFISKTTTFCIFSIGLVTITGGLLLMMLNMGMSKRLIKYSLKNVYIGDRAYVLEGGVAKYFNGNDSFVVEYNPARLYRVYKLAVLYVETIEDPLFSSPALDGGKFIEQIERIEKYNDELTTKLSLSNDIVPVSFLRSVGEVAIASDKFEKNINESNASELLSRYGKAMIEYRLATERFMELLDGQKGKPAAHFFGLETSDEQNQKNIIAMRQNIDLLAAGVNERAQVFNKGVLGQKKTSTTVDQKKVITKIETDYDLLDKDKLHLPRGRSSDLPSVYTTTTACMDGVEQEKPFYLFDSKLEGAIVALAKRADNNFYTKLDEKNDINKPLLAQGMQWRSVYEGTNYLCPDNTYQTELVTLDMYIKKYPTIILGDDVTEQGLYKGGVRSYGDLLDLAEKYEQAYQKILLGGKSPYDVVRPLIERANYIRGRQAGLEKLFATTFFLNSLSEMIDQSQGHTNKLYVNLYRANYSLTLFNFSPQVWRMEKPLEYALPSSKSAESDSFVDYYKLVSEIGQEQVSKINQVYLLDYFLAE